MGLPRNAYRSEINGMAVVLRRREAAYTSEGARVSQDVGPGLACPTVHKIGTAVQPAGFRNLSISFKLLIL
jgi:hypothetical protein